MSIANQNRMSAATEGCAAAAGYVTSDPEAMNGWEILRDAINDGRQIAIATRGGWMLLPWQIVQGMTDLLPHTESSSATGGANQH